MEKILELGESLRDWPVEGTTGYEVLNQLTALFVEATAEPIFTELAGASGNSPEWPMRPSSKWP